MTGRTLGEQQEIAHALKLLERIAVAMESMAVNSAMVNDALLTVAAAIDPEFMTGAPPRVGKHFFTVELPDEDAVLCQRCQVVQKADPHHPGHPDVHECVPWKSPADDESWPPHAPGRAWDFDRTRDRSSPQTTTAVPDRDSGAISPDVPS